jgi:DNA-binding transcriptional ArsR family regulator
MALAHKIRHLREAGMDEAPDQAPERYVRLPVRVLRQMGLSHGAIVLYGILLDYAGTKKVCWPAAETLAADMGMHRNTVHAHVRQLETAGLIAVKRHGKGKANAYALLDPADAPSFHAQPTVHETSEHAQPTVHEDIHAQPTVHGHAQPTVHLPPSHSPPNTAEPTPGEQTPRTTDVVLCGTGADVAQNDAREHRARALCAELRILPSDTAVRAMANVVKDLAQTVPRPLEDLAVDAADYLERHPKKPRTVAFFRGWVKREFTEPPPTVAVRSSGNGEHRGRSQTDESARQAAATRQDAVTRERLFKLLDRGGDVAEFYGLARDDPWTDGAAALYDVWREGRHRAGRGGGDGPVLPAQSGDQAR